jgi:four helix bundle protein
MSQPTRRTGFDAYDVALEIVAAVAPLVDRVRRRDPDLGRQLRRALSSIPLNLAEGRRRQGKDRQYHYTIAAGSADEVASSNALDVAALSGWLEGRAIQPALSLLDRELAMLWRLTH